MFAPRMKWLALVTAASLALSALSVGRLEKLDPAEVVAAPELKKETTKVSYDLNRDGSADEVEFVVLPDKENGPEAPNVALYVMVNGDLTSAVIGDWYDAYSYQFFELQKKTFMLLSLSGDGNDGERQIYSWEGKDFFLQRDLNRDFKEYEGVAMHLDAEFGNVTGNTLTMNISAQLPGLTQVTMRARYSLKSGQLKRKVDTYEVIPKYVYWNPKTFKSSRPSYLTTNKEIVLYKTKTCKKRVGEIDEGKKIVVTKVYIGGKYSSYYVRGKGWYKVKNNNYVAEDLFKGVMYVG